MTPVVVAGWVWASPPGPGVGRIPVDSLAKAIYVPCLDIKKKQRPGSSDAGCWPGRSTREPRGLRKVQSRSCNLKKTLRKSPKRPRGKRSGGITSRSKGSRGQGGAECAIGAKKGPPSRRPEVSQRNRRWGVGWSEAAVTLTLASTLRIAGRFQSARLRGWRRVRAKLMWTALAEDFGVVIVIVIVIVIVVGLFDYDNDNDNESSPFGISVTTSVWIAPNGARRFQTRGRLAGVRWMRFAYPPYAEAAPAFRRRLAPRRASARRWRRPRRGGWGSGAPPGAAR